MSAPDGIGPKFFENIDPVVKQALFQFLPPEAMSTGTVASKLFQKIMDDPKMWQQIATKLKVVPQQNQTFKKAVITRLKANAYAMQILPQVLKDKIGKIENPFLLNKRIKEEVASALSPQNDDRDPLLNSFIQLLADITSNVNPKGIEIDTVKMLLEDAEIMFGSSYYSWRTVLYKGLSLNSSKTINIPQHKILFKLLVNEIKKGSLPEDQQDSIINYILDKLYKDSRIDRNIFGDYCQLALEAGMSPKSFLDKLLVSYSDQNANWTTENFQELQYYFQFASPQLKAQVIEQFNGVDFLLRQIENQCLFFFNPTIEHLSLDGIKALVDRYMNVPQFVATLEGKPYVKDPVDRKNRIAEVQKRIEKVIKLYDNIWSTPEMAKVREANISTLRSLIPKD